MFFYCLNCFLFNVTLFIFNFYFFNVSKKLPNQNHDTLSRESAQNKFCIIHVQIFFQFFLHNIIQKSLLHNFRGVPGLAVHSKVPKKSILPNWQFFAQNDIGSCHVQIFFGFFTKTLIFRHVCIILEGLQDW